MRNNFSKLLSFFHQLYRKFFIVSKFLLLIMNYILNPTLEHIALVKIAATLWNQDDVKNLLVQFSIPSDYRQFKSKWIKIEAKAVKKVAELPLPKQMKEKILCFIRPIGFQISKWRQFHYLGCDLRVALPNEFSWTPQGTIDRKKTAEVMIKDKNIDITKRYKLACIFCLEDDIPKLWEEIPEGRRKSFYNRKGLMYVMQKELVVLWTYQIKGEMDKIESMMRTSIGHRCSPYQCAFILAAIDGNRVATEYFLQKMTAVEKEESLVKTAASVAHGREDISNERTGYLKETYSDVLCFLLSQLDEEQQLEVFKRYPAQVLACLLDWPWQSFFMETANRMWSFLPKKIYQSLFLNFTGNVIEGYKDFNYQKLFREFWEQSPYDYKRHVLSDGIFGCIASELLQIRDIDNLKLVFEDATLANKRTIIYRDVSQDTWKKLVKDNELSLLKYFIKECLPTKDEVLQFKEYFFNTDVWRLNEYLLSNSEKKFLRILNEIICEFK